MKLIAYILNIALLIFAGMMLVKDGFSATDNIAGVALFISFSLINIVALRTHSSANENWISLFFKRKALEERKKIEILKESSEIK